MPLHFRFKMARTLGWLILSVILLKWQVCLPANIALETVRIGVLAKRGPAIALARWSPTADYLSRTIPGYRFVVTPLDFEEIPPVAKARGIDFLLANSAIYVQSEHDFRAFRIATMNNRSGAYPLDKFGGVIFTRRDNTQINNLEDLQQHTLAAVNATSLGGFLMTWRELKESGIDIKQESQILYLGTHDAVVHAVLNEQVDAGTVRTDTLEKMATAGSIDLNNIKIIHPLSGDDFPLLRSTRLYPEWPMAALPHVPKPLVNAVAHALLSMPPEDPAAVASKTFGWSVPANYQPVHELFHFLNLPPHKQPEPSLLAWTKRHPLTTGLSSLSLTIVLISVFYLIRLNRQLTESQHHLASAMQAEAKISAELKHNLAQLKESEEKFAGLAESALDAIIMLDPQGHISFWNQAAERIFGYAASDAVGQEMEQWLAIGHEDPSILPLLNRYVGNPESPPPGSTLEITAQRKNGQRFPGEIALSSVLLNHAWHVICVFRDISRRRQLEAEQRRLETELMQHHKMEALAQLAGGVSHEINTPMQTVGNNLRFIQESFDDLLKLLADQERLMEKLRPMSAFDETIALYDKDRDELDPEYLTTEVKQAVAQSLESAEQVKRIVRSISVFASPDNPVMQTTDLAKLIHDLVALSRNIWSPIAEVHLVPAEEELMIECYPGELSQALLNLVINAVQAIEGKAGEQPGQIEITCRRQQEMACIDIRDNGAGIPVDAREHIFNPFFTTREVGAGSGQGLTLSHDVVVRRHHGRLSFETEVGKGTVFTVLLPLQFNSSDKT